MESEKIKIDGIEYDVKLESSDEKGTIDDEAMFQYISKARNATCQILLEKGYGSGFFCKIPYTENKNIFLNVLITCEHVLEKNLIFSENFINIIVNNKNKKLSLKNRKKWSNEKLDYSCIEILEEDEIDDFYQIDDIILKKNYKNDFYIEDERKNLIIFAIMKNQRRGHANGLIKNINEHFFVHNCNTDKGASGGVIVNKNNNCVIGIHKGEINLPSDKKGINVGIFIYNIITDIIQTKDLPLFLNKDLTESKIPVDYIIDSIKSKDKSFYIISNENRFQKIAYINNDRVNDDFFVIRLYSSIYFVFLNEYLKTKKILSLFRGFYGFSEI